MNKNIITNVVALAVAVGGHFSPAYSDIILMTGLFALSGGMTNWLAVHMLFEIGASALWLWNNSKQI